MAYQDEFGASDPPQSAPQSAFGHPVYDQIGSFIKQHTGADPTFGDVSQWGTNVDQNYMAKIQSAIYNSAGAQAYRTKQAAPPQQDNTQQQQQQQQTQSGPPVTGSPVTANGQIPPPAPSVPQAQPAQKGAEPKETRYVTAEDLSKVPGYQARTFSNDYKSTAMPDAYKADQFSQFTAPDQSQLQNPSNALMSSILGNPQTLNPQVVAQMKEQQKEQALLMRQQAGQGITQNAAARGVIGGGQGDAQLQNLDAATISKILEANRGIDISAAQTNRGDELNALNAAEQLQQGQFGRAVGGFGATLSGQSAQAGANQTASNSALQRAVAGEQANQFGATLGFNVQKANADEGYRANQDALNRVLAQFGINQGVAQNAQQNYAADLSTELGRSSSILDYLKLGENSRQFNDTLGFNYNNLDQNGQLALIQSILGR